MFLCLAVTTANPLFCLVGLSSLLVLVVLCERAVARMCVSVVVVVVDFFFA